MPTLGKYRLGVKLYTLNIKFTMTKPHNGLTLTLLGFGPDIQALLDSFASKPLFVTNAHRILRGIRAGDSD